MRTRSEARAAAVTGVAVAALAAFLLAALVVVAVFVFSVRVSGSSMRPTLSSGDRLEVDLLHRHDIKRFDIVEATEPGAPQQGGGAQIVKRVVGMPGDRIAIAGGDSPAVLVQPSGSSTTYRVENPTWVGQIKTSRGSCCLVDGKAAGSLSAPTWVVVPAGSYWVIGDNWGGSSDSRWFGFVRLDQINGKLGWRIQPWGQIGSLSNHARLIPVLPF